MPPAVLMCAPCVGDDDPPSLTHEDSSEQASCDKGREDQRHLGTEYDARGYCVHHPQVRMRKKKVLGGNWLVLLNVCPKCCLDEMYRLQILEQGTGTPTTWEEEGTPARDRDHEGRRQKYGTRMVSLNGMAALTLSHSGTRSTFVGIDRSLASQKNKKREPKGLQNTSNTELFGSLEATMPKH